MCSCCPTASSGTNRYPNTLMEGAVNGIKASKHQTALSTTAHSFYCCSAILLLGPPVLSKSLSRPAGSLSPEGPNSNPHLLLKLGLRWGGSGHHSSPISSRGWSCSTRWCWNNLGCGSSWRLAPCSRARHQASSCACAGTGNASSGR